MEKGGRIFRSRISVLLISIFFAIFIPITAAVIKNVTIQGLCIVGGTFLMILFSYTGYRYIISGNKLYLKIWFISMGSADIADIISIERTYNPIASPAASLKRLCLRFKKGSKYSNWLTWQSAPNWLLSPVRENEFIEKLKAINPDIYVHILPKTGKWRIGDWDI